MCDNIGRPPGTDHFHTGRVLAGTRDTVARDALGHAVAKMDDTSLIVGRDIAGVGTSA